MPTTLLDFPPLASALPIVPAATPPDYEALAARFRPIFARIAEGAVEREERRILPHEPTEWLRAAGFPAVRIPQAWGGLGATIPQLFRLLVELAEADSNVAHLFRGHFAFLEGRLQADDPTAHAFWFPKVVSGAIIGYAMAERTAHTGGDTRLTREGGHWVLEGTKYYSTGTLYADWIVVSAFEGEERVSVAVPVDAPGVTRLDDWDGFGQRLTGSGTTKFDRVLVPPERFLQRYNAADIRTQAAQKSFLQLVLLATLAGIARAVRRDVVAFVQPRTRTFGLPGLSSPRADPLVQRVIGRIASLAYSAETLVDNIAAQLESLHQAALVGALAEADYVAAEIKTYQVQQIVIEQVLEATTLLFEVGGASATSEARRLDRHWRNARTVSSHNPAIHRERAIGDFYLNGTIPDGPWRDALARKTAAPTATT